MKLPEWALERHPGVNDNTLKILVLYWFVVLNPEGIPENSIFNKREKILASFLGK